MNMMVREQIKVLLAKEKLKMKDLAILLQESTGKIYSLDSISHRLQRGTFTYNEVVTVAELLGYNISFVNKQTKYSNRYM